MTTIAIAITSVCVIAAAIYAITLHNSEEPKLTDNQLAEMSVNEEWWHAN